LPGSHGKTHFGVCHAKINNYQGCEWREAGRDQAEGYVEHPYAE